MPNDGAPTTEQELAAAEKDRRRRLGWATAILLIGLPIYIVLASWLVSLLTDPVLADDGTLIDAKPVHWLIELAIYLGLGLVWAFPLKGLVQGLGKKAS